jgi:hypothetical protein
MSLGLLAALNMGRPTVAKLPPVPQQQPAVVVLSSSSADPEPPTAKQLEAAQDSFARHQQSDTIPPTQLAPQGPLLRWDDQAGQFVPPAPQFKLGIPQYRRVQPEICWDNADHSASQEGTPKTLVNGRYAPLELAKVPLNADTGTDFSDTLPLIERRLPNGNAPVELLPLCPLGLPGVNLVPFNQGAGHAPHTGAMQTILNRTTF